MISVVKTPALLDKVTTMKDGSLKIVLETQELGDDQAAALMGMRCKLGWFIFAPEGTSEIELPQEPVQEFKGDKSPSRRLRDVLYRYWEKQKSSMGFEDFYKMTMNGIIDEYKEKLDGFF